MDARSYSLKKLQREFSDISQNGVDPFTVGLVDDNYYHWSVMIEGPENSLFEGGLFSASIEFPQDYPLMPPKVSFTTPMWHPNIYPNGEVCMSILHPPEHDQFNEQEKLEEKWRPILGVREIVISIVSMLTSPNTDSPANVDAAVEFKKDYAAYKRKVRALIDS